MAFKKIEKTRQGHSRLNVPAIHLCKTTSALNLLFCEALGLKAVGKKIGVNLHQDDEDPSLFALEVSKKDVEDYSFVVKFSTSRQCQIYLKSILKSCGYQIDVSCACPLTKQSDGMWTFNIPDKHKITAEDKAGKATKRSDKKGSSHIRRKNKRKRKNNSDLRTKD